MTYPFTQTELDELEVIRDAARISNDYSDVYKYILFHTSQFVAPVLAYQDVTHVNLQDATPLAGVDKSVWLWARGAFGVNSDDDSLFSNFIRDYTSEQHLMRYGVALGPAEIDGASDDIADAFATDIIDTFLSQGLPTLNQVGKFDAGEVASGIFNPTEIHSLTYTADYAPWAGTILFPFLGEGSFFRDWVLTTDIVENADTPQSGDFYKALAGTYDLISIVQASQSLTSLNSALGVIDLGDYLDGIFGTGSISETIQNNSIGEAATLQLLADLRQEATDFFKEVYDVTDSRFDIGEDLPLYGSVNLAYIANANYIVGTLTDDVGIQNIVTNDPAVTQGLDIFGRDIVHAGLGNDIIKGSEGNDLIDGGEGVDTLSYLPLDQGITVTQESISGTLYHERFVIEGNSLLDSFTDFAYSIENLEGTGFDDTFHLDGPAGRVIDGGGAGDYDRVIYTSPDMVKDNRTGAIYDAHGLAEDHLSGIEFVSTDIAFVLPDTFVDNSFSLQGGAIGFDYSSSRSFGGEFNFFFSDNITIGPIGFGYDSSHSGTFSFAGGVEHSGNIQSSDNFNLNLATLLSQERARPDQVVIGTNNGDTFNFTESLISEVGIHNLVVETGTGNDTLNFSGWRPIEFRVEYRGGNDVINGVPANLRIDMWEGIVMDDVTDVTYLGNSALLTVDGFGTLEINSLGPDVFASVIFKSGGSIEFDDTGVTYSGLSGFAGAIEGTWGDDTITGRGWDGVIMYGKGGDDFLYGSEGDDTIYGGVGFDYLQGAAGNDILIGGAGDDTNNTAGYRDALWGIIADLESGTVSDDGFGSSDTLVNIANIVGSGFDDLITGSGGDDFLSADAGDDTLNGGVGVDYLQGGLGFDTLIGGTGDDTDNTAGYGDALWGIIADLESGTVFDDGFGTSDTLVNIANIAGSAFDDIITGSGASNELAGEDGADSLDGLGGDDLLLGGEGYDFLDGGDGNDQLYGGTENDTLQGSDGNDTLDGEDGDDILDGGAGIDRVTYVSAAAAVTVSLATTVAQDTLGAGIDTLTGIENLTGSSFDDTLIGDSGANSIEGGDGNDLLQGGLGDDSYYFTVGHDTIIDIGGNDILYLPEGVGVSQVSFLRYTTTPQDLVNLVVHVDDGDGDPNTALGTITIYNQFLPPVPPGNTQTETLRFQPVGEAILTDMRVTTFGGALDDTILGIDYGANPDDTILGFDDADTIASGAGNDTIFGGTGNDTLLGQDGGDALFGEEGDDWLEGGEGADFIFGDEDSDGSSSVAYGGTDTLLGGDGADWIEGNKGNDTLIGGNDSDVLFGNEDNDTLNGDAGNDYLVGGTGDDILKGGSGSDNLYSEAGADILLWDATTFNEIGAVDNVYDFDLVGGDKLDVSELLSGYDPVANAITDFIQITDNGTNSTMAIDVDGSANGTNFLNLAILYGVTGLTDEEALETNGTLVTV